MDKVEGFSFALALLALSVCAQPAVAPKQGSLFSLPEPQLRPSIPEFRPEEIKPPKLESDSSWVQRQPTNGQAAGLDPLPPASGSGPEFPSPSKTDGSDSSSDGRSVSLASGEKAGLPCIGSAEEGVRASVSTTNIPVPFSDASSDQPFRSSLYAELVSNPHDDSFSKIYHRLEQGGYLTRPPVKSDSLLDRGKEAVGTMFTPVPFHVGKTEWSCSVVTAIERRNPLCLLNPIPLNISW